ncbi:ABC transporter permease/substrate-binding protein [Kaistella antarctica]|uniref:Osmoprotectant-binding protein n=1 Tax=Kaistella antarctica TaxID=266748 RepID=A0A448NN95_9FLAO|nr:ABC transporter permease/substrate-binding protein [Kaistella antarctica]KEY19845.1 osmoprotection protein [Kaistella antarctica]SEV96916.1 osmoprotectant transport system permease protein [Kaistella antarctica]VEH96326.1 Osmoprotectant-binding protein [Kaistella antarctica]
MDFWERRLYYLQLLAEHLLLSLGSLLAVTFLGILIGIFVFYSSKSRKIILPLINFLYTIPSIAMFGLLIPLVGIGLKNALIVLIIYGLLPIVRSAFSGLKEVPTQLVEAAQGLGSTPIQVFKNIYFPLALPSILSGLRITVVMIVSLTGLAALIGAGGLGQAIFRGLNTMNTGLIVTGSLGISLFAILGDQWIGQFEKDESLLRVISRNATKRQRNRIIFPSIVVLILSIAAVIYLNPLNSKNSDSLVVASKPTSEQFILGEIIAQTIEDNTDIIVVRKFGIGGGTTNIHPAMISGDLDIYVEYTGTAWLNVLEEKLPPNNQIKFENLNTIYQEKFKLKWLGLLGFNNTYGLAISKSHTQISTYSELAEKCSDFTFGAEFDFFERSDAFPGLKEKYPFQFKKLEEMDINLRYQAFEQGKIDAVDVFTTDAQIKNLNLKVLKDDKNYFPSYEAGIVARQEILEKHPEIEKLLFNLKDKISTEKMQELNYAVEVEKKSPAEVAKNFLNNLKNEDERK